MMARCLDRDGHPRGYADRTPELLGDRPAPCRSGGHATRPAATARRSGRVMCRTETGQLRAAEGHNPGRPTKRTFDPPSLRSLARFHRRQRAIQPTRETLGSDQLRVRISMGLEDPKDTDLLFGSGAARHGWDPNSWMRPASSSRPREGNSPVADPLTQARTYLAPLPEQPEAAAAPLVDLWAAAARHGITPNHCAWSFHPPCAALGTITAAGSGTTLTDPERGGS